MFTLARELQPSIVFMGKYEEINIVLALYKSHHSECARKPCPLLAHFTKGTASAITCCLFSLHLLKIFLSETTGPVEHLKEIIIYNMYFNHQIILHLDVQFKVKKSTDLHILC